MKSIYDLFLEEWGKSRDKEAIVKEWIGKSFIVTAIDRIYKSPMPPVLIESGYPELEGKTLEGLTKSGNSKGIAVFMEFVMDTDYY